MPKIKIDAKLYKRMEYLAEIAGYSSPEEFIIHLIERELEKFGHDDETKVKDRLRGLGYIE